MNFNVTYDSSVTSQSAQFQAQYMGAVNAALSFYEHAFTNNVTINITFAWGPLSGGAAAENSFYLNTYSYATVVNALKATQKSPDDIAAYATLPSSDPTGAGNSYALTSGQAKALGLGFSSPYDDFVTLGSNLSWTFDPNNRAVPGEYDAIGAIEHEISEGAFGRVGSLGSASAGFGAGVYTPLDLFRYSSSGTRNFSTSSADYFSVDGTHLLQEFNINSQFGGDISDWYPTIQGDSYGDAYQNTVGQVTQTDIRELDILGWNVQTRPADFNGDAVSDLLWRNTSTGAFNITNMYDTQTAPNAYTNNSVSPAWTLAGTMDFNGDRLADLVWSNSSTGQFTIWEANVATSSSTNTFKTDSFTPNVYVGAVSGGWSLNALGDFNGDGKGDLIWQNGTTFTEWQSTGTGFTPNVYVGGVSAGWTLKGIGDFNGDGKSDLLWANGNTFTIWDSTGNGFTPNSFVGTVSPGWNLAGVGDFNGDGKDDLLWSNGSTFTVWSSTGTGFTQNTFVAAVPAGTTLAGVGDYSGSGLDDLVWRNPSTGDFSISQSTGSGFTPNVVTGNVSPGSVLASNPLQHTTG